ncbi:unnamed protein product [Aureobasidium mustum]|uniref:BZIP domain-containing protein n=1 Tax=Aureobasidium mustum TaxID=2773714 RepID=A0A9N8PFF1_9PEZI|nr:unnamed protein product [Aureobasidium mustum]
MSHWSNPQGPPSIHDNDGYLRTTAPTSHSRHASNTSSGYPGSTTTSPQAQRHGPELLPPRGLELPPLVRTPVSPSVPRSVTLPSVLNPVTDETSMSIQRRRKADEIDSPLDRAPTLPPLGATSQGPTSLSRPGSNTPLPLLTEPLTSAPRKMLTPKSPLRRAISLSHLNPPNGVVDAQQNPFPVSPRSRPYAVQPGTSGAPPLPAPPAISYAHQGYMQTNHPIRTVSPESGSAQRYSASPSPDYSAYDQTSPGEAHASGYLSVSDAHRARGLSMTPSASAPHVSDSYHVGLSGSGSNSVQMMTLKTTEGDVRFPVDVQAASRVADEKRRRNAGASARFRERRKRKEMEASQTIARLEQQVKDMTEDADFYRQDRDVLASIVSQFPGGREHLPRPQSPRARRNGSGSAQTNQGHYAEAQRHSPEPIRNVRKRGDSPVPQTYVQAAAQSQAPPPPPPANTMMAQHHIQPHHNQMPARTAQVSSLPPPSMAHAAMPASNIHPPPPPSIMQAPPMTGPVNPYARHETGIRFLPPHGR